MNERRPVPTFAMRAVGGAHVTVAAGLIALLLADVVPNLDTVVRDFAPLLAFIGIYLAYAVGVSVAFMRGWRPKRLWQWPALAGPSVVFLLVMGILLFKNITRPQEFRGFGPSILITMSLGAIIVATVAAYLDAQAGRAGPSARPSRGPTIVAAAAGATALSMFTAAFAGTVTQRPFIAAAVIGALIVLVALVRARHQIDLSRTWGQLLATAAAAGFVAALVTAASSTLVPAAAAGGGPALLPPDLAIPNAATTATLAEGQLAALPSPAPLFVEVSKGGTTVAQTGHAPGFVYGVTGTSRTGAGDQLKDVRPGEAAFVVADAIHGHSVTGTGEWLFLTVRPTAGKAADLHGGKPVYQSDELPSPPGGANREGLLQVSLGPGGRSGAFKPNGVVTIYVIEGELELRSGSGGPQKLAAGQGAFRLQGTPMNLVNVGSGTAKYLEFFLVPAEQTFQTVLPNSP